jgi:hypothetical protein
MINQYQSAMNAHLETCMKMPLHGKYNSLGEPATWNDRGWQSKCSDATPLNLVFHIPHNGRGIHFSTVHKRDEADFLPAPWRQLIMSYALHCESQKIIDHHKRQSLLAAKILIVQFMDNFTGLTNMQLKQYFEQNEKQIALRKVGKFIKWCQDIGILRKTLRVPKISYQRVSTLEYQAAQNQAKMPSEQPLLALAAIFNDLIPKVGKTLPKLYQSSCRSQAVVCMTTLAMASPNRVAAEQQTLGKQRLKSQEIRVKGEGKFENKTIHYLDWTGSKGYSDNRNHILASMAEPVTRAIDWLNIVCEPARVLCRFYESPTRPLKELLGDFNSDKLEGIDLELPVNMFRLGWILGFYDLREQQVRLRKSRNCNDEYRKKNYKNKTYKHVSALQENDFLFFNKKTIQLLIGVTASDPKFYSVMDRRPTVAEFQKLWIDYMKEKLPTYPYRKVGSNRVKLSDALLVFTGEQYSQKKMKSGYLMGGSFFAIESLHLDRLLASELKPTKANQVSIFERFNFSKDIAITPHQFRHWINTKAQESGLSDSLIAMFSGRRDIGQNAVYDHTSDSDKVARIASLIKAEPIKRDIRVIAQEEYETATGKATTVTPVGLCTQDLSSTPCKFLSDFNAQCVLCSASCHVNRDLKAIDILEKDLSAQKARLEAVNSNPRLTLNTALQRWFIVHHNNTSMLEQLIILMKREDIKEGSPIRYVPNQAVFRIADMKTRRIEQVKALLPNSKSELEKRIADLSKSTPSKNQSLENLLTRYNIQEID